MANRENPVQTANSSESDLGLLRQKQSNLGLHCLSRPIWQVTENGE